MKKIFIMFVFILSLGLFFSACDETRNENTSSENDKIILKESQELMPTGFEELQLGIGIPQFRKVRFYAQPDKKNTGIGGRNWWTEKLPNGTQVLYGFKGSPMKLVQVQFLNLIPSKESYHAHITALQDRYGYDPEIYLCPPPEKGMPWMIRLIWKKSEVSLAEALIENDNNISATITIQTNKAIEDALETYNCQTTKDIDSARNLANAKINNKNEQ